jgi:hypothetical protein
MKIQVNATNSQELFDWLNKECLVKGQKIAHRLDKRTIKDWHGDVIPGNADRGHTKRVFEVSLNDNCQAHLTEVEHCFIPKLRENYEYTAHA